MDRMQLLAFARRDRAPVEALRAVHWSTWKAAVSALEALTLADELRRHALELHPLWPSEEERLQDLEAHRRVAEALGRVHADTGR